jgi:Short C-terminal domain
MFEIKVPELYHLCADELMKLANLKDKGIISDEEFQQMKQDLIRKT